MGFYIKNNSEIVCYNLKCIYTNRLETMKIMENNFKRTNLLEILKTYIYLFIRRKQKNNNTKMKETDMKYTLKMVPLGSYL